MVIALINVSHTAKSMILKHYDIEPSYNCMSCFKKSDERRIRVAQEKHLEIPEKGQYYCRTVLDRVLGARAAGVRYRLFSVWTLVPVRLDQQLSDHSTVDEIASGAADCRLTYTMANCPQRRLEKPGERRKKKRTRKRRKKSSKKTRAGRFRKRRGESQSFLLGDADQESETRMSKNALRTGRRQAVE
ncbi:hypothetical protein TNCV_3913731 [Trichonephila clavipes]|nr:hypothetical protein TNCV_3913731 [Trichonephila clavipes]